MLATVFVPNWSFLKTAEGFLTQQPYKFKRTQHKLGFPKSSSEPKEKVHLNEPHRFISLFGSGQEFEKIEGDQDLASNEKESLSVTFNAVKNNFFDGEVGSRGEAYFVLQVALVLCILFGTVPFFGNLIELLFGPGLVLVGGSIAFIGALELGTNLTPWPNPPKDGNLITEGMLFDEMRHPIYAGLLALMFGLSIWSGSAMRVLLSVVLFYLLDFKSELEEEELIKKFGMDYINYSDRVPGKFVPHRLSKFFDDMITTIVQTQRNEFQ